jgi:large subunit ribosomal protein L10
MNKTERQETVESLTEQFKASPNIYVTDFSGLNVLRMTEFRRRLRAAGVTYIVVKNTLAQRALAANSVTVLDDHLAGPTGMILAGQEPIAAAQVLTEFAREFDKPAIKNWLVDVPPVTADQVKQLASLPPKQVLLSQLAGAMQAPVAQLGGLLNGILYQMVGALEALRAQRS